MDDADIASLTEERERDEAMARRKLITLPFGKCGYCEEPITAGSFCDAGCRDDYERITKVRA